MSTEATNTENKKSVERLTTGAGCPLGEKTSIITAGRRGPALLQDSAFIDEMAHFVRERIPERVVHAKGAGAFGEFKVTHDITQYCKASVFSEIGKTTNIAVRFSTSTGAAGSPDTVRDGRGFAVKFYTEDGIWDLAGLNLPIFFINDPYQFPSLIHSGKPNPVINNEDANTFWDFWTLRPETTNMVLWVFSDEGTPDGYRHMKGYGCHAFKMVNAKGEAVYCKFLMLPNQGIKFMTTERAQQLKGTDPNYATRDLFDAIDRGDFPSWNMFIQTMTFEQAESLPYNPFDVTKEWFTEDGKPFEWKPVGRLTLNRNPKNYFADIEQMAFSPSHLVPGIEPSPDKLLQGRLFAYPDSQRYRLGANYLQIPVNCPFMVHNYQRDGAHCATDNQGGQPNYYPNSFNGPDVNRKYESAPFPVSGDAKPHPVSEDNFSQATKFWKRHDEKGQETIAKNIAQSLGKTQKFIQDRALNNFEKVDTGLKEKVQAALKKIDKH